MRAAAHDVVYAGERSFDPGVLALLSEAVSQGRVFVTKDHDIGVLVYRDHAPHYGVLLLDDVGDPIAETNLILSALRDEAQALLSQAFVRVSPK
jgi:predicted nuclease of predicted toxin-antitoxin system